MNCGLALNTLTLQTIHKPFAALLVSQPGPSEDEHPNPYAPGFSRTAFLRKRLFLRQERWSSRKPIRYGSSCCFPSSVLIIVRRIRATTYNVNDKLPPPGTTELASLVGSGEEDILVFGFQEVGELYLEKHRDKLSRKV